MDIRLETQLRNRNSYPHVEDKNGHILPYVKFDGGKLELRKEAIEVLDSL